MSLTTVHLCPGVALVASGAPREVLTEQLLADVFDLEARAVPDPVARTPLVMPVRRLR